MKKVIIGGFLSLIGTLGDMSVFITAGDLTAVSDGMMPVLVCSSVILAVGLIIMGQEYSSKDDE